MFKIFGISLCLMISLVPIGEVVAQSNDREGPSFSPWFDPEFPPRTREAQVAEPFKIFDNVYYVGLQSVSSYLITTNQGLILIDPTYDYTADLVLDSIRELGFDPVEIEYLLITHGHGDHASGAKVIQEATGAAECISKLFGTQCNTARSSETLHRLPRGILSRLPRGTLSRLPRGTDLCYDSDDCLLVAHAPRQVYPRLSPTILGSVSF